MAARLVGHFQILHSAVALVRVAQVPVARAMGLAMEARGVSKHTQAEQADSMAARPTDMLRVALLPVAVVILPAARVDHQPADPPPALHNPMAVPVEPSLVRIQRVEAQPVALLAVAHPEAVPPPAVGNRVARRWVAALPCRPVRREGRECRRSILASKNRLLRALLPLNQAAVAHVRRPKKGATGLCRKPNRITLGSHGPSASASSPIESLCCQSAATTALRKWYKSRPNSHPTT